MNADVFYFNLISFYFLERSSVMDTAPLDEMCRQIVFDSLH